MVHSTIISAIDQGDNKLDRAFVGRTGWRERGRAVEGQDEVPVM